MTIEYQNIVTFLRTELNFRRMLGVLILCCSFGFGIFVTERAGYRLQELETLQNSFWMIDDTKIAEVSSQGEAVARIVEGALEVTPFIQITSSSTSPIHDIAMELLDDSKPIHIVLRNETQQVIVDLGTEQYQIENDGQWFQHQKKNTKYRIYKKKNRFYLQIEQTEIPLRISEIQQISLSSKFGKSYVNSMRILNKNNSDLFYDTFDVKPINTRLFYILICGALIMGMVQLHLSWNTKSMLLYMMGILFIYVPYLGIIGVSSKDWILLREQLYLTQNSPEEIAQFCWLICLIPTCLVMGMGLPIGYQKDTSNSTWWKIWCISIGFLVIFTIQTYGFSYDIILKVLFLILPGWLYPKIGCNTKNYLLEIPIFLCIFFGGWDWGFGCAAFFRVVIFLSSIRCFLQHKVYRCVEFLIFSLFFILYAVESILRHSYLRNVWNIRSLAEEYEDVDPSTMAISTWNASCGNSTPNRKIVYMGGSSTGGTFQFRKEPELFFAGQTHKKLCLNHPQHSVTTQNFGQAGMDTHVIAHALDPLLHTTKANLVVLYVGNNDLLTKKSVYTRKQRYLKRNHWLKQGEGLKTYTSQSCLFIGFSLLFRQLDKTVSLVQSVPLEDAEENFHMIAKIAQEHQTKILLLPEFINPSIIPSKGVTFEGVDIQTAFNEYSIIQQRMAETYEHVFFFDMWNALKPHVSEDLFIDANHLNEHGNRRIAEKLEPEIAKILQFYHE